MRHNTAVRTSNNRDQIMILKSTESPKCNVALACKQAFAGTRIIGNQRGVAPS